jgi:hypothetical protein
VAVTLMLLSRPGSARAQEKPFTPTEAEVNGWLAATTRTLRARTEPDETLAGSQYFGLLHEDRPVGYEVFRTEVVEHDGRQVYHFDDRGVLRLEQGGRTTAESTGLSDASFSGLRARMTVIDSLAPEAAHTVRTRRRGGEVWVTFPATEPEHPIRVRTGDRILALSGELPRLLALEDWQPGPVRALWHLEAANLKLSPVLLRALPNERDSVAGRRAGPVRIETWIVSSIEPSRVKLSSTTFFDRNGRIVAFERAGPIMGGLLKVRLTEAEFRRDWQDRFDRPTRTD